PPRSAARARHASGGAGPGACPLPHPRRRRGPLMLPLRSGAARAGLLASALWTLGCAGEPEPDAYGSFEAIEVVVSAQTGGQVQEFAPLEGMELPRGAVVALIDTTQLSLERRQIVAQREAASARGAEADGQLRVVAGQRRIAQRAQGRAARP